MLPVRNMASLYNRTWTAGTPELQPGFGVKQLNWWGAVKVFTVAVILIKEGEVPDDQLKSNQPEPSWPVFPLTN